MEGTSQLITRINVAQYRETIAWLESLASNAWPALQRRVYDGWMLGFANGYTRRANSVSILAPGYEPLEEKIAWCEEKYRVHDLPTIFKLTPFTQPESLDRVLHGRGYRREAESEVRFATMEALRVALGDTAGAVVLPQDEWLGAYARITGQSAQERKIHQAILQTIVPAVCPVAVLEHGDPVGVGLGVFEDGLVGIFDLVTDPSCRRRGYASRILAAIFAWAAERDAYGSYLQVMADNAPAQALYAKIGFRKCYRYWYRVGGDNAN